jgi:hypothetical protein
MFHIERTGWIDDGNTRKQHIIKESMPESIKNVDW